MRLIFSRIKTLLFTIQDPHKDLRWLEHLKLVSAKNPIPASIIQRPLRGTQGLETYCQGLSPHPGTVKKISAFLLVSWWIVTLLAHSKVLDTPGPIAGNYHAFTSGVAAGSGSFQMTRQMSEVVPVIASSYACNYQHIFSNFCQSSCHWKIIKFLQWKPIRIFMPAYTSKTYGTAYAEQYSEQVPGCMPIFYARTYVRTYASLYGQMLLYLSVLQNECWDRSKGSNLLKLIIFLTMNSWLSDWAIDLPNSNVFVTWNFSKHL